MEHGVQAVVKCKHGGALVFLRVISILPCAYPGPFCLSGLAMEKDNKDMLKVKKAASDMILIHFTNASNVDFKMDVSPGPDFKAVCEVSRASP